MRLDELGVAQWQIFSVCKAFSLKRRRFPIEVRYPDGEREQIGQTQPMVSSKDADFLSKHFAKSLPMINSIAGLELLQFSVTGIGRRANCPRLTLASKTKGARVTTVALWRAFWIGFAFGASLIPLGFLVGGVPPVLALLSACTRQGSSSPFPCTTSCLAGE